jgi:hypothetical protein
MIIRSILAILLLSLSANVQAAKVEEVMKLCSATDKTSKSLCFVWFKASVDTINAMQGLLNNFKDAEGNGEPVICIDDYHEAKRKFMNAKVTEESKQLAASSWFIVMAIAEFNCTYKPLSEQ